MKKVLIMLALSVSFLSVNVNALSCADQISNISGLDDVAKQQMISQCEQTKLDNLEKEANPSANVDEKIQIAEKWAHVAQQFVTAIGMVAAELGKTVNEFLPTPAGILTAVLITWQVMGDDISGMVSTLILASLALLYLRGVRGYCKSLRVSEIRQEKVKGWFGSEKIKNVKVYMPLGDLCKKKPSYREMSERSIHDMYFLVGHVVGVIILIIAFI